jgi:hypothetical protein
MAEQEIAQYIAVGFGLSMFIFFIGQTLRVLTDAGDTMLSSKRNA